MDVEGCLEIDSYVASFFIFRPRVHLMEETNAHISLYG